MPLLNGEQFVKRQPPKNLSLDEEVFFLPATLEIFREYDDYFERTILVNSVTWNCDVCGRGPSTYNEALMCERADYRQLNAFNTSLASGLLYIIANVRKQRLPELVELLCEFAGARFFVGEPVEFQQPDSTIHALGIIERVLLFNLSKGQSDQQLDGSVIPVTDDKSVPIQDPMKIHYLVRETRKSTITTTNSTTLDSLAERSDDLSNRSPHQQHLIPGNRIQRRGRNAVLARDHLKFFIRHTCELKDGVFTPKVSVMQHYHLYPHCSVNWTSLFSPPEPQWSILNPLPPPNRVPQSHNFRSANHNHRQSGLYSRVQSSTQLERAFQSPTGRSKTQSFRVIDTLIDNNKPIDLSKNSSSSSSSAAAVARLQLQQQYYQTHLYQNQFHQRLDSPTSLLYSTTNNNKQLDRNFSTKMMCDLEKSMMNAPLMINGNINDHYGHISWDTQRAIKAERNILEREWTMLRRREDLELSDLAVLPDFPKFPTKIPVDDLGSMLQLLEFFHIFGNYFGLLIPQPSQSFNLLDPNRVPFVRCCNSSNQVLSFEMLEKCLTETDNVCGSLADLFISLLSAIRRLELDVNVRQPTPTALTAAYSAASAVATAEAGLTYSNTDDNDDEATPADSVLVRVLREAATSTRLCELVGIPTQGASNAAGKAAIAAASVLSAATGNMSKDENSNSLVHHFGPMTNNAGNRSSVTRAATMAAAAGAASLPPLDRAGLTEALWLHLTSAAAKGGGWRGQIWGGTRPLDDPSVMLSRNKIALVEKLKTGKSITPRFILFQQ